MDKVLEIIFSAVIVIVMLMFFGVPQQWRCCAAACTHSIPRTRVPRSGSAEGEGRVRVRRIAAAMRRVWVAKSLQVKAQTPRRKHGTAPPLPAPRGQLLG